MSDAATMTGDEVKATLSALVPTHDEGEQQTASGRWVSERDAVTWHEAAHAVVYRAFGGRVLELSIDPERGPPESVGFCHIASLEGCDALTDLRVRAITTMAGPIVTVAIREGLAIEEALWGTESLSARDAVDLDAANAALLEGGPEFEELCQQKAITVVLTRREAFAAIVAALLDRETLDEAALDELLTRIPR
jgi:hypothetical protein